MTTEPQTQQSARTRLWLRAKTVTPIVAPYLIFVFAPLAVFPWHFVSAGMMDGGDDTLSNLPMLYYSAEKLLRGEILWTPDLWLGAPVVQDPEYAVFYLPRLLLPAFHPILGFALYVLLHFVMAQATAYGYLRQLGLQRVAATFGAVGYGFCGFMLGHQGHTMYLVAGAWAPLFLYFLHRATTEGRPWQFVGGAIAYAPLAFTGAFQLAVYLATVGFLLSASLSLSTRSLRPLLSFALFMVPGALVSLLQILPSLDWAEQLHLARRGDYAFNTHDSWHPTMVASLFLPSDTGAEWYSRAGVAVVSASVLGLIVRWRDPWVRAWAVVGGTAVILMLGDRIPVLPHLLHSIPGIGIFRAPVRHNFELGLALCVLAALGLDWLVVHGKRLPGGAFRWATVGPLIIFVVSWGTKWWGMWRSDLTPYPDIVRFLKNVGFREAALASGFLLIWVAAVSLPRRWRLVGFWCVVCLTLGEAAFSVRARRLTCPGADFFARYQKLDLEGSDRLPLRLLPDQESGLPTMPLNTALLRSNAQSMLGYASAAPSDMAYVLNLDMHGFPVAQEDLRWSRLPSIFGVNAIVMPEINCLGSDLSLDAAAIASGECSPGVGAAEFTLGSITGMCAAEVPPVRFVVTAGARTLKKAQRQPALYLKERTLPGAVAERKMLLDGPGLASGLQEYRAPMTASHLERRAQIYLNALDPEPVEFQGLQVVRSAPARAVIDTSSPNTHLLRASTTADGFVLRPGGGEAVIHRKLVWQNEPEGEYLLEVVARRIRPTSGPLVVDLYGSSYDPEGAQLVVESEDLIDDEQRTFRRVIRLSGVPEDVSLRAYLVGTGVVEIGRVALTAQQETAVATLDTADVLKVCGDVAVDGNRIRLAAPGEVEFPFHLPRRPVTVQVRFADSEHRRLSFAVTAGEVQVRRTVEASRTRYSETLALPSDADTIHLAVHPPDRKPMQLRFAELRDACKLRDYRATRKLADGLVLYRNHEALPRVYTPRRLRGVRDLTEARESLRDSQAFVPGEVALVEIPEPLEQVLAPAMVDGTYFGDEQVLINVRAPQGETFVVINDHYDDNWVATVDGVPTAILRTNGLVRGVRVPQGKHVVQLWVRAPYSLWVGAVAALLGLLLAALVMPWAHSRLRSLTPG